MVGSASERVEYYNGWIKVFLFMDNGFFDKKKDRGSFRVRDMDRSWISCPVKLIYESDGSFDEVSIPLNYHAGFTAALQKDFVFRP